MVEHEHPDAGRPTAARSAPRRSTRRSASRGRTASTRPAMTQSRKVRSTQRTTGSPGDRARSAPCCRAACAGTATPRARAAGRAARRRRRGRGRRAGECGSPSRSENAWCLRWSATHAVTGPSIAAEPSAANTPRSHGVVLNDRCVNRRWKPTVTPHGAQQVADAEDHEVAPVQELVPDLPRRHAERDDRQDRDRPGQEAVQALVADGLDVLRPRAVVQPRRPRRAPAHARSSPCQSRFPRP